MTFKDRFLWKEGDIVFSKCEIPLTEEQIEHAKKRLDEIIKEFEKKHQQGSE